MFPLLQHWAMFFIPDSEMSCFVTASGLTGKRLKTRQGRAFLSEVYGPGEEAKNPYMRPGHVFHERHLVLVGLRNKRREEDEESCCSIRGTQDGFPTG